MDGGVLWLGPGFGRVMGSINIGVWGSIVNSCVRGNLRQIDCVLRSWMVWGRYGTGRGWD